MVPDKTSDEASFKNFTNYQGNALLYQSEEKSEMLYS